jgi:hypothetical protein
MRPVIYPASLAVKVTDEQRLTIEYLSLTRGTSLGEATRTIISNGILAMNLNLR